MSILTALLFDPITMQAGAPLHRWNVNPKEAILLQIGLRERLVLAWDGRHVNTIGGVDVNFSAGQARAAIVVLSFPDLEPISTATAETSLDFPYIPGLLAFREAPAILAACEKLPCIPDLLMFDGQGIAHPRGCGIAAHLGLWLDTPTIGVAKSRLCGCYAEVGYKSGDWVELRDEDNPAKIIGAVARTRQSTRPIFISPGHRIDLPNALRFTLACCKGYRLPEPTRLAHQVSGGKRLPVAGEKDESYQQYHRSN